LPELQSSVRTLAGDFPLEAAAINGLSRRHPYSAICVPGYPSVTDRITVIAAKENLGPQLARYCPAALYGSLPGLSPSKGCEPSL